MLPEKALFDILGTSCLINGMSIIAKIDYVKIQKDLSTTTKAVAQNG